MLLLACARGASRAHPDQPNCESIRVGAAPVTPGCCVGHEAHVACTVGAVNAPKVHAHPLRQLLCPDRPAHGSCTRADARRNARPLDGVGAAHVASPSLGRLIEPMSTQSNRPGLTRRRSRALPPLPLFRPLPSLIRLGIAAGLLVVIVCRPCEVADRQRRPMRGIGCLLPVVAHRDGHTMRSSATLR